MRARALRMFGADWEHGKGSKDRMKARAAAMGAESMVQLQDPDSGGRHFACYATWDEALRQLKRLRAQQRHLFEVIPHGRPCKPYLDLDGPPLPCHGFETVESVVDRADRLIQSIFRSDYGLELPMEDLIWSHSPQSGKLSLHLVVCTRPLHQGVGPPELVVYSSNHQSDPNGAAHLAQRIRQLDAEHLGRLVDVSVYTKDREMRTVGASKRGDPGSALVLVRDRQRTAAATDNLITCLEPRSRLRVLEVPGHIPRAVRRHRRQHLLRTPEEAAEMEPDDERAMIVTRMLDLLREGLHPSAFHDRRSRESPRDPEVGVKFGYADRSEACYTGNVHDGRQNMRLWVDTCGDVYVRCFSTSCSRGGAHRLGSLHAESDSWRSGAVRIDARYLDVESPPFRAAVDRWLRNETHCLSIRSPMGSGKSTFLEKLLGMLGQNATVLVVTYRQSLAMEIVRKLRECGFVSYLDTDSISKARLDLTDRRRYPRVICQVESLWRLCDMRIVPIFDVVVLDEVESLLRHFTSPTVPAPIAAMDNFMQTAEHARRGVVTMDAAWGACTDCVLRAHGLSNLLVVNENTTSTPRHFAFGNDAESWKSQILEDLAAGLNVVLVSLSSEQAMAVHESAVGVVGADLCLLHTSKTGDDIKAQLSDVDALWASRRFVAFSPTIAAGVDFSAEHFDRMYIYLCGMSALPSTALQMAFRARKLSDPCVRGLVAHNMRASVQASRPSLTSADMMVWLRWMETQGERATGYVPPITRVLTRVIDDLEQGVIDQQQPSGLPPLRDATVNVASLPPITSLSRVVAFVEAEKHNAQSDYLHEFAKQAEAAGHRVTVERKTAAHPALAADTPSMKAARMLDAAPIEDENELESVRTRVMGNIASEDDKWRLYVETYKAGWGIDHIDAAFLAANGDQPGCPKARLLARVLCPELRRPVDSDVNLSEQKSVFKVVLVDETIAALGLRSPFDHDTVIPDLMDVFNRKLCDTPMFREYNDHVRLFRINGAAGGVTGNWDLKKVAKALNMILGAVGLELVGKETRVQSGLVRKKSMVNYQLAAESVQDMMERVKLRLRRCGHTPVNEHARECLQACQFARWGHLVDNNPPSTRWTLLIHDDGED